MNENHADITEFEARLHRTVEENVLVQLDNLRTHPTVAAALGRKEMELHGWVYRFESGEVFAFDPKTRKFDPLEEVVPAVTEML